MLRAGKPGASSPDHPSCQADAIAQDARFLFPDPFNLVAGYLAQRLHVAEVGWVIGQEFDLCPAGQILSAFFETQNG